MNVPYILRDGGSKFDCTFVVVSDLGPIFSSDGETGYMKGMLMTDVIPMPERWAPVNWHEDLEVLIPENPAGHLLLKNTQLKIRRPPKSA